MIYRQTVIKTLASKIDKRLWMVVNFIFIAGLMLSCHQSSAQRKDKNKLTQWAAEGDTLMNIENFEGAVKVFSKLIAATGLREKADYRAVYKRAVCYYYLDGKEDLALADIEKFISVFPEVTQAYILRALIYRIKEDANKQLEDLNIALDFQQENAGLLKWRAGLLLDKEEYIQAKSDAEKAIQLEDDPEVETYLAFAHFNLNHPDSALLSINTAIDLDYTYSPAYLYASSFCMQKDEFDLALTYINLGLRVDPENVTALFYKGVALIELKRTDEGCRFLNKAFYKGYDDATDYLTQYCYSSNNN